jgi:galactoside O-acetyltransferase
MIKKILNELFIHFKYLTILAPGKLGSILRYKFWNDNLDIQENHKIDRGAEILHENLFKIGANFILGENVILDAGESNGVYIGNFVGIARNSFLRAANHKFDSIEIPWMLQGHEAKELEYNSRKYSIVIEDDVWIGAHCIILSGAHIGKGSVISAGSVVASVIPPYSIVAGNPARVISNRLKQQGIKND